MEPDRPILCNKRISMDKKILMVVTSATPTPNVIVLGKYDLILKEGILNENVFIWHKFSFP